MTFILFAVIVAVAPILANPVPPWWAAPVEHVAVAFITVTVPSLVVIVWGNKKRNESHVEHIMTKAKLDSLAEHAAVVVTQQAAIAQQITQAIAENTGMTAEAAAASKEAAAVANDVNSKIAETLGVVKVQQAQEQTRQEHER